MLYITDDDVNEYEKLKNIILNINNNNMASSYKHGIAVGLIKIRLALMHTVTMDLITKSFTIAGFNNLHNNINCNSSSIFQQYFVRLTIDEDTEFNNNINNVCDVFSKTGTLTDIDINDNFSLIVKNHSHDYKNRDNRCQSQQRCIILNHTATLNRLEEERLRKLQVAKATAERKAIRESKKQQVMNNNNNSNSNA